jgi:hypothetical protein
MRQLQNIAKVAEVGGSGAEVNPRTPYTLLPLGRECNERKEVRRDNENKI